MRTDNLQHLRQYFGIGGHDVAAFQPIAFAVHIGDDGTGFFGNQGTGGDVPRFEVEFKKAVDTAAGHMAQIE